MDTMLELLALKQLYLTIHQSNLGWAVYITKTPGTVGYNYLCDQPEQQGCYISHTKEPLVVCISKAHDSYLAGKKFEAAPAPAPVPRVKTVSLKGKITLDDIF